MALRTPLYDWHLAHGARMVDFAGWDMPVQYTSLKDEHLAVRSAAGLFDISHMGRLTFEGPDALDLIQHVWTNDAAALKPGQVRYGLVCNELGGVRDDVLVYRLEPFWLMVVNASNREKILHWIEQNRPARNVTVSDSTPEWAMVALQGPRSLEVAPFAADLKYYFAAVRELPVPSTGQPIRAIVSRTGYTGEDGCEVIFPAPLAEEFCTFWTAEARRGGLELKPCGLGARDTLRLEAGMPLYGHELTEEIDPFQAGLAWAVKMDKGDFLGQEALQQRRQDSAWPQRVGLELEGKRIAREGAAVLREGREVGRVTSGSLTPTLDRVIAVAYVDPGCTAPGTACEVDVRGKPAAARVVPLPFYRRPREGHCLSATPGEESMIDPKTLRYSPTHEWAHLQGDVCTIGITKFAVEQLTDIVYVELPHLGDDVLVDDSFGEIESVKAVSDLYAPVNGEVIEVNESILSDPSILTQDPYGAGWLIRVKVEPGTTLDKLLTLEQYEKQIASEGH